MRRKWRREWSRSKSGPLQNGLTKLGGGAGPLKTWVKNLLPPLAAAGIMLNVLGVAQALPTDVVSQYGQVNITQTAAIMNVNQGSYKAVVDSRTFVINPNETLNIYQPSANAAMLWKVVGNDPAAVYGHVNANGHLFLTAPGGVLFARGAQVNTGGLVASSLNISDRDFLAGNYKFTGDAGSGAVVNQGTVTATDGGYVALLGPEVKNEGVVVASRGTVALAAGQAVTLDMNGDKLLSLAVDQAVVRASAANHNLIQADGGQVLITARAADALARTVVNNTGLIQARSVNNVNGEIILDGGPNGQVADSGTLDAAGRTAGQTGGTVKVLGDRVTLTGPARVDVGGANGGGTALIGGNARGQGPERNAAATTVAAGAVINADAVNAGNGGQVVVWADGATDYCGAISARGGAAGGNGGQAEVSGKEKLSYRGVTDLRAPNGQTGTLLLDPNNYTIANSGGDMTPDDVKQALASANLTILSSNGATAGDGDINVQDAVTWDSANTLTLSAYRDINVNADITGTGGGNLVLRADNTGRGRTVDAGGIGHGTVNLAANINLTGGDGSGNNISLYYNPADGYAGSDASGTIYDPDAGWTVFKNPYQTKVVNGNLTAYMLVNTVNDLQNIITSVGGNYALGKDIDASSTRTWNGGKGFRPIQNYDPNTSWMIGKFNGIFDGGGHVIDGLYINGNSDNIGLFSCVDSAGTVRNLGLTNVDITGAGNGCNVGSLAGSDWGGAIINCYSTGKVTGNGCYSIGGLIGNVNGSIANSYSKAAVSGNGAADVGGLVGYASNYNGSITNCYSTGAVTVTATDSVNVGGLIGDTDTGFNLNNCYSASTVTVTQNSGRGSQVGGLVGNNGGTITSCYSAGSVSLNNMVTPPDPVRYGFTSVGGLIGYNKSGNITNCYSTSRVAASGGNSDVGGLLGFNLCNSYDSSGVITNTYSSGPVTAAGDGNSMGGLVGYVDYTNRADGFIPFRACYWDTGTSGLGDPAGGVGNVAGAAGVTGLTTADLMSRAQYGGWDFANTWIMIDGYTRPFLRSEYSTVITNAHQLQLMVLDPGANYVLGDNINFSGLFSDAAGMWNTATGFVPIIGSEGEVFTGTFDGQGHSINGLTINNPAFAAVGLFGRSGPAAKISNVGLTDLNIAGGARDACVGGLVGYNDGGVITNVYSTGAVSGPGDVGGLVGFNTGRVAKSYSMGTVSGAVAGGLVGINSGTVADSYFDAAGQVTGQNAAGGIAGGNSGSIVNVYNAGAVSGGLAGGLVGDGSGGNVVGSVWDTDTSGQQRGVGSDSGAGGVKGLRTAQMGDRTYYSGWDFADTWALTGARPLLKWEYQVSHYITSLNQLLSIGNNLGGVYILGGDITLTGGWTAVGSDIAPFTGIMKGNGYTLRGLSITNSAAKWLGLFGYTQGATISSLNLADVSISGGQDNLYVGGLVGYSGAGTVIRNCSVSGLVTAAGPNSLVGGLVGYNAGAVEYGINRAVVKNTGSGGVAGGIVGLNDVSGRIVGGGNAGPVTVAGAGGAAGGLAGVNDGLIDVSNNDADGAVAGEGDSNNIGGLAGENNGSITGSGNQGQVKTASNATNNNVGGIAGKNTKNISGCYVTGRVTAAGAAGQVGGLAGRNEAGGSIADSYSLAPVINSGAGGYTGGLVGKNSGAIARTFNIGATIAAAGSTVGGLAGANDGTVTDAYWDTETTGQNNEVGSGGAAAARGLTTADMMKSSTYGSWDMANTWSMLDGASFPYFKWQFSDAPSAVSGVVRAGGIGRTVAFATGSIADTLISPAIGQTMTVGANGFYYALLPAGSLSTAGTVTIYVSGDGSFKANSVYKIGSQSSLIGGDLVKDTVIIDGGQSDGYPLNLTSIAHLPASDAVMTLEPVATSTVVATYSYVINGSLWARNIKFDRFQVANTSIRATGSITIETPAGIIMNPVTTYRYGDNTTDMKFVAGGDITIIVDSGDFIIRSKYMSDDNTDKYPWLSRYGVPSSTQISAGGNVTIACRNGRFVNFGHGDAIVHGGRLLVYTRAPLLGTANDLDLLFNERYQLSCFTRDEINNLPNRVAGYSDEMGYDITGGLASDFLVWGASYGDAIPAAGSGFIYQTASPLTSGLTLTPRQIMRREARIAACRDYARPGLAAGLSGSGRATPPLITITGRGVALTAADSGQITAEPPGAAAKTAPDGASSANRGG